MGASTSGGVGSLFLDDESSDLAANDDGGLDARRFEAKLGFGLDAFGYRFTITAEVAFGLSNDSRAYGLGWRPNPPGGTRPSSSGSTQPGDDAESVHGLQLRLNVRWKAPEGVLCDDARLHVPPVGDNRPRAAALVRMMRKDLRHLYRRQPYLRAAA